MRVALHNIHQLPINLEFHGYVLDLLRRRKVTTLYFSDRRGKNYARTLYRLARSRNERERIGDVPWRDIEFVFSASELRRRADVLLNLNLMYMPELRTELSEDVRRFDGLKVFHIGDYFWYHPASEKHKWLQRGGVDHLFGYAMHDRYCSYFNTHFPAFRGKVWGIPFGFAPRFQSRVPFADRQNKAVAVGSVNPLRPLHEPVNNYRESADFFPDESWFHRFRRQLVLEKDALSDVMDSMLPEFPKIKDFRYDLQAKFNEYRMFVTCESIYFFPAAKVFEGTAAGSALMCSDHACLREYGFADGQNCVMFRLYDTDDFRSKVTWFQQNPSRLGEIAAAGHRYVTENYTHAMVADHVWNTAKLIWERGGDVTATPIADRLTTARAGVPA